MSRRFVSFATALVIASMAAACGSSSRAVDATVSVEVHMAAMPSMNMPKMRSTATLMHQGNGKYIADGQLQTPGNWDTTVTVTRGTDTVATKKLTLAAQ
jgi:hypothetical protein